MSKLLIDLYVILLFFILNSIAEYKQTYLITYAFINETKRLVLEVCWRLAHYMINLELKQDTGKYFVCIREYKTEIQ